MTSRPTSPTDDPNHTGTEIGTTVTVTTTVVIRASPTTATMINHRDNYPENISTTTFPSAILFYEDINGWSHPSYASQFQAPLTPPATTNTSTAVRDSNAEELNEFSFPPHSLLVDFPLYSFPPFIPFTLYSDDTPENNNSYIISSPTIQTDTALNNHELLIDPHSDRPSPELIQPLYATAITSTIMTAPVQQETNNSSYSSLLTDPFETSDSPLVFEEDQENQEVPGQQEDVYNSNETIEDEQ